MKCNISESKNFLLSLRFAERNNMSYQNYIFLGYIKGVDLYIQESILTHSYICSPNLNLFNLVSRVIYHTGRVGSALCTAGCASTGILSACSDWVSSPRTHQ